MMIKHLLSIYLVLVLPGNALLRADDAGKHVLKLEKAKNNEIKRVKEETLKEVSQQFEGPVESLEDILGVAGEKTKPKEQKPEYAPPEEQEPENRGMFGGMGCGTCGLPPLPLLSH